jgi:hypothetical protein
LGYSPSEILLGFNPVGSLESKFPTTHRQGLLSALAQDLPEAFPENDEHHCDLVVEFMIDRVEVRRAALANSDFEKDRKKERHDLGVRGAHVYAPGDLAMLFDHRESGKKLRASWRGPFVVTGFGGDMHKSYTLRQIDGTPISRHYHGDSLKPFRVRTGRLITQEEEALPTY